jgi:hypothetical protein
MSWDLSKIGTPSADAIARWKGLAWLLGKITAQQTNLPAIQSPAETISGQTFGNLQAQADSLARRAADAPLSDDFARALLQTLAAVDSEFAGSKNASREEMFRRAERLVLALDRLSDAIVHQATREVKNPQLARLFDDVRSRGDFEAARFANHLATFRATIGQTTH